MFQFMGNVVDALPGVGHVKGALHYAFGDTSGGHKAMYEATRSTAVLVGGAIGAVAGPAGAIAGATGAGLATDSICSIATQQPQGVVEGLGDVASDIFIHNKLPVKSILRTGALAAADMAGGLGMGGFSVGVKEVTKTSVRKVVEISSTTLLVAGVSTPSDGIMSLGRDFPRRDFGSNSGGNSGSGGNTNQSRSNSRSNSRTRTENNNNSSNNSSGSGSERPNNNRNNINNTCNSTPVESEEIRLLRSLFNNVSLKEILLGGKQIFRNLSEGQIHSLNSLIRSLQRNRHLEVIIRVVVYVCEKIQPEEVSFQNFLSICEFVNVYLEEQFKNYIQWSRDIIIDTEEKNKCFTPRDEVAARLFVRCRNTIIDVMQSFREKIEKLNLTDYFRDIYSALYHYYKHRNIPNKNREIGLDEYLGVIETMMSSVKDYVEYRDLSLQNHSSTLIFEKYYNVYNRRVRIVLKSYRGRVILSSCFIIDSYYTDDRDGDEFIIKDED